MEEKQLEVNKRALTWERLLRMDKAMHAAVKKFFFRNRRFFDTIVLMLLLSGIILLFLFAIAFAVPAIQERTFNKATDGLISTYPVDSNQLMKQENNLKREIGLLAKKLNKKTPVSAYLIVNTSKNKFFLYKKNELIGKGKCSTGSYILLSNGDEQQWIFKTPRGVFQIKGKTVEPVWIKPDWAFVEEGIPIPSVAHPSRYEYGVLGDYALSLGQGYMIHGTIYQRFLGLPVTHGCIRLNDDDLNLIYHRLSIGSKVFIY